MSLTRFPLEKYASLELNQVAFPKTGMVVSQTPLGSYFTASAPCENGMWVLADKSKGVIEPAAAVTDAPIGIVYTAEKEYDYMNYGLKNFGRKVEGDYPRVGILGLGDTVTTNCLQYDTSEFASFTALETALNGLDSAPMYVVAVDGEAVPQLTASLASSYAGPYAKVTKYYTVPNGEKGVKYEMISLG